MESPVASTSNHNWMTKSGAPSHRFRFTLVFLLVYCAVCCLACNEDFDPPTLITELRVLGIGTDPADLVPLETASITSLVAGAGDEPVSYHWQLCLVTGGPDEGYECQNDLLGFPEEVLSLFALGNEPNAEFPYLLDAVTAREMCESLVAELPALPDFVVLPDCEKGLEVTLRLTVATDTVMKVAIKRLFLWFEDPGDSQRNHNPAIDSIAAGGATLEPAEVILVEPGGRVRFDVLVSDDSRESCTRDDEEKREELLFSWFSSEGEWERQYTYTEEGRISLAAAGSNWLHVDGDIPDGTEIEVFLVIRDGRGGSDWERRVVRVVDPNSEN